MHLLWALSSLRGLREAPEVPPLCRETHVGTVGKNGLSCILQSNAGSVTLQDKCISYQKMRHNLLKKATWPDEGFYIDEGLIDEESHIIMINQISNHISFKLHKMFIVQLIRDPEEYLMTQTIFHGFQKTNQKCKLEK